MIFQEQENNDVPQGNDVMSNFISPKVYGGPRGEKPINVKKRGW